MSYVITDSEHAIKFINPSAITKESGKAHEVVGSAMLFLCKVMYRRLSRVSSGRLYFTGLLIRLSFGESPRLDLIEDGKPTDCAPSAWA